MTASSRSGTGGRGHRESTYTPNNSYQVTSVDDLLVGDRILFGDVWDTIGRIEEKPKTRLLHFQHGHIRDRVLLRRSREIAFWPR